MFTLWDTAANGNGMGLIGDGHGDNCKAQVGPFGGGCWGFAFLLCWRFWRPR